jgi:hypothetical protein
MAALSQAIATYANPDSTAKITQLPKYSTEAVANSRSFINVRVVLATSITDGAGK